MNLRIWGMLNSGRATSTVASSIKVVPWMQILVLLAWTTGALRGQTAASAFEQANKLYEESQFTKAAAAYQQIIDERGGSSTLYFNLGNAHFKDGQLGRAIAAYHAGWTLHPRDPSLRFNLQFARQQVSGHDNPTESVWARTLTSLTLNEWTGLFSLAYWIWLGLLCLGETKSSWRRGLRGYTATAGLITLILVLSLGGAWYQWFGIKSAVVVAPESVVRFGPLEESQVHYSLRDGSEVRVLDRKTGERTWLQVRDESGREGWLKVEDVLELRPALLTHD